MTDELALLETQAAAIDGQAAATEPGAAGPEVDVTPVNVAAEVAALVQTVAGILTPAFPSLAEIYTEATCKTLGEATAPVLEKYDVSMGGIFDRWGAEITLGAVAFPLLVATVKGIRTDIDRRRNPPPVAPAGAAYAQERAGQDPNP